MSDTDNVATREAVVKKSDNKRYYRDDFRGLNLSGACFRNGTLVECNFSGADLSYANFENANCWGSNFENAVLYRTNFKDAILASTIMKPRDCFGMTVTLTCNTIEKMEISDKFLLYWLFMGSKMTPESQDLANQVIAAIGAENYVKLGKLFRERTF